MPVLLAALRVAHPTTTLESPTVSATGPLLISSDDSDCDVLEVLGDDPVCDVALLLDGLELVWPDPLP
jgi:hypothetical protein